MPHPTKIRGKINRMKHLTQMGARFYTTWELLPSHLTEHEKKEKRGIYKIYNKKHA